MEISGTCETADCSMEAIVGINGMKVCLGCFQKILAAAKRTFDSARLILQHHEAADDDKK
jgi:hypothetical protein